MLKRQSYYLIWTVVVTLSSLVLRADCVSKLINLYIPTPNSDADNLHGYKKKWWYPILADLKVNALVAKGSMNVLSNPAIPFRQEVLKWLQENHGMVVEGGSLADWQGGKGDFSHDGQNLGLYQKHTIHKKWIFGYGDTVNILSFP